MASLKSNAINASEKHESKNSTQHSSSKVSSENLMYDLQNVLEHQFVFKGSFAYASKLRSLNPCLNIDGIGLIGLPLSERDAKLIIECSDQAPYGHGQETLVNKQVRDTWEIDPHKVSFLNQAWEPFVHSAVQTVCSALGVQASQVPPRCELYKLLLYEPGSHFLPHQDTQKADGMFATMIILLPSAYKGGQVHVSHGKQSRVFDFSADSIMSISVLSWYMDVIHEVKPVISGYRLALSYNLIHVSTAIPKPMLPTMDKAVQQFRQVLRKWKKGAYPNEPDKFIAYILDHQYSEHELLAGMISLKGVDAHKLSFIRPIAEEQGFTVYLGNLTYQKSGGADDDGSNYYKRRKYYYDEDDEDEDDDTDDVSMVEVFSTEANITCVVDLNGMQPMGSHKLSVNDEFLLPIDSFEHVKPDDKEYEGYMGNGAGTLDYWYHRTVLVIFPDEDTLDVAFSSPGGGFEYGLSLLKKSNNACPTQKEKDVVSTLIKNLGSGPDQSYSHPYSNSSNPMAANAKTMIEYALKWNDPVMWSSIMERAGVTIVTTLGVQKYFEGCRQFFFCDIEPGINATFMALSEFKHRLDFIDAIRAYVGKDNEKIPMELSKEQTIKALSTLQLVDHNGPFRVEPHSEDVELLLRVVRAWSLDLVNKNALIPLKEKRAPFKFWTRLVESLVKQRASLCVPGDLTQSTQSDPNFWPKLASESEFREVLKYCLEVIIPQWNEVSMLYHYPLIGASYNKKVSHTDQAKIDRILQILKLSFSDDQRKQLLTCILSNWADIPTRCRTVYVPLIPQLIQYLNEQNLAITSAPFNGFARVVIYLYLHHILGSKGLVTNVEKIKNVGCGCGDCRLLDVFIANTSQKETVFRMAQARRTHLEMRLRMHTKFLYMDTIRNGSPHGLKVTKRDDYFASMTWEGRKAAAGTFLRSFGNNNVLKVLVGGRWDDVSAALQGTKRFELANNDLLPY